VFYVSFSLFLFHCQVFFYYFLVWDNERLDVRCAAVRLACGLGFGGIGVHPLLAAFLNY
jgi:hypothetical protein